jgi:uncharacterized Rmd1/YagE family protein
VRSRTTAVCAPRRAQEMLEVLRDHQNNEHMSRLEWIVIILIALAVRCVALLSWWRVSL